MKNGKFSRLLDNNRFLFLLSVLGAILLWGYVVVYVNNQHSTVIRNVPINMQYRQSLYQSMGLDVIEMDIDTVDVYVSGARSSTGDLSKEDIIVYPNITAIDGSGIYTFTLTAERTSSVQNFSIDSLSQDYVTVRFDTLTTKEFSLSMDISSIVVSGDNIVGAATVNPSTVTITGPKNKVDSIKRVVAVTETEETIYQTSVRPATIIMYDENGAEVDRTRMTFSDDSVDITIPVLQEVTLPIRVDYVNVPSGFDTDVLHQSLSRSEIHLAVPSSIAPSLTDYVVGYIDLSSLRTDEPYTFEVKLPTGYMAMDETTRVSANISSSNLSEKVITVDEIKVINDADERVSVLTKEITNVVLVGESERVESLSEGGVIAQVDAARIGTGQGTKSVEVEFVIPSTDKVYVRGVYLVNIKI